MNLSNNEDIVSEIKSRCNIVDVIGQVVTLKKMGANFKGVCPFHNEKTPSFVVSETKQVFTCFGCSATGDVFEFVKRYYNLDFMESIEKLGKEYNVQLPQRGERFGGGNTHQKEMFYQINKEAATFYFKRFFGSPNPAMSYMMGRDIDTETLKKFGVGYADEDWQSLYHHFVSKGIEPKVLLELGLISESKGKYYDKFRNRVIFPIISTSGKVIGFGGRSIKKEDKPKYLNSPETPVFLKKNNLYAMNITKQDVGKENAIILVEGYMDVISLYQSGIRNVAATLGTALTENQGRLLKRYTQNVILSYDSDSAGQVASLRGMDILHKEGCKVKILTITGGKDPDEFVKKNGKEAFNKLINTAMGYVDYKIDTLKQKYDLDSADGNVDFLKAAVAVFKELSPVEADIYIKKTANELKISENAIRLEINGNTTQKETRIRAPLKRNFEGGKINDIQLLEKNMLRLMIMKDEYYLDLKKYEHAIKSQQGLNIYRAIKYVYEEKQHFDLKDLSELLEYEDNNLLNSIIEEVNFAGTEDLVLEESIHKIKLNKLLEDEQHLILQLSMADEEENQDKIKELTEALMTIQKQKSENRG